MSDTKPLIRFMLAELLGTFMLVFAGTGAIIINGVSAGVISHLGIALTFGFIVLSVIYTYGDTSGAHINPAVTIAFWVAKRFPGRWILPYVFSQAAGGLLASGVWKLLYPSHPNLGATLPAISNLSAFTVEFLLTWWLMTVILAVSQGAKEKGLVAGIVIGCVVAVEAIFAGPITGASMNPARSLGPALISGTVQTLWIYLLAPTLGAIVAVYSCRLTKGVNCCDATDNLDNNDIPSR